MKSVKLATELIAENGSHQSIFRQRGEGGDSFPTVCLQSWCESEAVKDYGWVIIQYVHFLLLHVVSDMVEITKLLCMHL